MTKPKDWQDRVHLVLLLVGILCPTPASSDPVSGNTWNAVHRARARAGVLAPALLVAVFALEHVREVFDRPIAAAEWQQAKSLLERGED